MIRLLFGQRLAMAGRAAAVAAVLAFAGMMMACGPAPAQETAPPAPAAAPSADPMEGYDDLKAALDGVESSFKENRPAGTAEAAGPAEPTEDALMALMGRLAPLQEQISQRTDKLNRRLKAIEEHAAKIPPPPAEAATEDPKITAERQQTAAHQAEVKGALHQFQNLADKAGRLEDRIRQARRDVFNKQVFARSPSPFDPAFWGKLGESVPAELNSLLVTMSSWEANARANAGPGGGVAAAALLAVLGVAVWFLSRWRRRLTGGPAPRRFDKALAAAILMISGMAKWPVLIGGAVWALSTFRLMPDTVTEIGFALAKAALAAGIGRGVAAGLFAPGEPDRRIVALTDQEAASYAAHLTWAARITALAFFANEVHRILGQPVELFAATKELQAAALVAITVHQAWRTAQFGALQTDAGGTGGAARGWLRAALWLAGLTSAISLATGYAGFSVFVAIRLLAAFAVGGAVFVVITVIEAALTDLLAAGTPGGRSVAMAFGLTSRGLDLVTMLASALVRLVIAALAVMLALNASGVFTDDMFSALQRAVSDYDIGAVHVSPAAILLALACLIIGGLAVRGAQRWLAVSFLPRTGLEAGLQNSIVALSGYLALIIVLAAALGILGIDLQKIALIAGALSVGIGFGLQSVVSNFVSGLILLAERTIRVGDWVIVKDAEGFVRRISIRSTEIETFDRASVIIPNQEFITGVVKNLTRGNTVGRVIVKIRVAFDTDVMRVRELMLESAVKHPQVLPGTPAVFVMGFGDIGIDMELMCLIGNVSQGATVRTDLYMDILNKLRDARIRIPYPIHDAGVPAATAPAQAAPKIA
jgi:potassium-dependent mechanosensitive channel